MVRRLHEAGIEVILDVVYNHTAEGNHLGPTLSFRGIDNASYYMLGRGPALLFRHHRLRQHGQPAPSARAADGDGFAALLGRGVPRRRLPLRPRHRARPRIRPVRPERRLLRRRPPGPGPAARQADRRAVGSRPQRLPGRQLPARLGRVERPLPRHHALASGRATRASCRRFAAGPARLRRPLRPSRPQAVGERQLRHRPRRLHPRRPVVLQRQAQRGQRRGQPRRPQTTTAAGTAASRGRPTTRTSATCATACGATSSPRCCSPRARR